MSAEQNGRPRDDEQTWEVAGIGGGSAGLSAALTLARARRSVIVIDAGQPRNAPAAAAHGLLGQEGVNPLALLATGRQEAAAYGARILPAAVTAVEGDADSGFTIHLAEADPVRAGQILIVTGVRDEIPDLDGLAERWGRDVVHCPYCHGWEIQDQRIALLATGPMSALQALLFGQWSERMSFIANGLEFPAEQLEQLAAVGITVIEARASGIEVADDRLAAVLLDDGARLELDALALPTLTTARLDGLAGLGLETETNAMGTAVTADAAGHTSVPGVWAAGNVVNPGMQVSESAAHGARVAMTINTELVFARAARAVSAAAEQENR